jgi:Rps23 Pro-64 3,4-dihydroxylase Tpa1-like proline 4-hydroxylase
VGLFDIWNDIIFLFKSRQFLYVDFKDWLVQATNIRLTDKIDMTSSKYEYTGNKFYFCIIKSFIFLLDYLLCHDDDIHGTIEGRRIAFIYYLVPDDWKETDGGTLDLFDTDGKI